MLDPAPARELSGKLLRGVSWITPNETETQKLLKTEMRMATPATTQLQIAFLLAA